MNPTAVDQSDGAAQGAAASVPPTFGPIVDAWLARLPGGWASATPAHIMDLLTQIRNSATAAGAPMAAFTYTLNALLANQTPTNANPLQALIFINEQSQNGLRILAGNANHFGDGNTTGQIFTSINAHIQRMASQHANLVNLLEHLNHPASAWSNGPQAMLAQVEQLRTHIQALNTSDLPANIRNALNAMDTQLAGALQTYRTSVPNGSNANSQQAQLALSNLREAFHQARLDFFVNSNHPANSVEISAAQAGVRSEQLRQTDLLRPYEDTTTQPSEVTEQELDQVLSDLNLHYQVAVSHGDRDAMAHIEAKIRIVSKLRDLLKDGTEPLLVGLVLFLELRFLDITHKRVTQARLREEMVMLQQRNDPSLETQIAELTQRVDGLEVEIDSITRQISQVMNQFESVLATWSQTQVDAFSKAF